LEIIKIMLAVPTLLSESQTLSLAQRPPSQQDRERKDHMHAAWQAYRGEFQKPLKISPSQPDDNVISNRCAPIVDKGTSFLFGQVLKIECTDETTEPGTKKQDLLNGLWGDDDERMTLLSQTAINGGVCGQPFLKLIPPQGAMKYPRVVVMNPQIIRIVTSPDDCSLILAYVIEYPTGIDDLQKKQIIARIDPDGLSDIAGEADLDDTWAIANYLRKGDTGLWMKIGETQIWDYPFPPIFTCQNLPNPNEAWGMPDLTPDLINQNKVLNFIQSNTSRIIKFHGHPKTYATGLSATQINIGVDDLICLPSPDSKLANLEMQGNLADQMAFAAIIRTDMDEQSRVPAVSLGRLSDIPRGNISGVALQLLFQPLIEKTTQKRRLYGGLIREVSRAALVLMGLISLEEYENYPIDLHWGSLLPTDDLVAAQTGLLLRQLQVSNATILSQLGYDPVDEAEKVASENAQQPAHSSTGINPQPPVPNVAVPV
jgi:Phage portal protein, SPP1 Gp6-like